MLHGSLQFISPLYVTEYVQSHLLKRHYEAIVNSSNGMASDPVASRCASAAAQPTQSKSIDVFMGNTE